MNPPFGKQPNVWAAVGAGSTGAGMFPGPFTDYPVFKGLIDSPTNPAPPAGTQTFGTSTANDFPGGDIDAGGNVYAVWAMNNARTNQYAVWISASHDGGKNFYGPFQVSSGPGSAEMPWIAGGDNGRIDVVFYQTTELGDPNTSNLHWNTMFAQSLNANSREPVFTVSQLSDHIMHFGPICNNGLLCGTGTRILLDFFEVAISSDGLANVVYADTGNANSPSHVSFARQNSGPLAKANPTFATCLPPLPSPTDVVSHKIHGASFVGDIHLLPPNPGIEMRRNTAADVTPAPNAGRDHELIITFPVAVNISSVTVTTNNPSDTPAPTGNVVAGNGTAVITVDLHNIQNPRRVTVGLNSPGFGPATVLMGVLLGDRNSNALVNSTDTSIVQSQSGQALSGSNFPSDVNVNGQINSTDTSIVQSKSGTGLP
jgi:hypothetical protein